MTSRAPLSDLKTLWQNAQREDRARATKPKEKNSNAPEMRQRLQTVEDAALGVPPVVATTAPPTTPPARKKTKTLPHDSASQRQLFQRQMRKDNVAPLPPSRRAVIETPRPAPLPKQRWRDESEVLTLAKYGDSPSPAAWDIGQEWEDDQTFLRAGLSSDVLRKLRRGQWAIQRELDLHGMIVDEAHDALVDLLVEARTCGWRCVRIIHGKGLTSPGKTPVLKGKVRRWLALWDDVLAYCEPAHHAGGGGAVVVLLRGR
jgi:DNA-nicking Smr family endonuclease